ncbi:SirB2 family protein [Acinetobacter ursingii]|uniref:SirB2 family protein n=1 Tax=Acinetobacter ursingii TaxID=108980 RepID=UPI000CAEAD17|nr:SirB2 family protein [Acinetobacter ursingii]MCU4352775.1 SirB2 family protein [Acinetobacter ursingii]MDI3239378.1 SirB2 family protein [Acinetobacter ursingii]PMC94982.1 invasion protein expression up-regulator SirB [Acinetobacter ursingii]PPZ93337.1 invasion protein expression up-regulator SirB [Acinetobacter ursingii]
MDIHLFFLVIHLVALALAAIAVLIRSMPLWMTTPDQSESPVTNKLWIALQHSGFTLVVITGLVLLSLNHFQMQSWFYAKIILFVVMLSSFSKAFKKDQSILVVQRKAGLVIGCVAFVAILGLVMIKPVFG